jgi:hypothetical protein
MKRCQHDAFGGCLPFESGAKVAAAQTFRAVDTHPAVAERLDCGVFTAAFHTTKRAVQYFREPLR